MVAQPLRALQVSDRKDCQALLVADGDREHVHVHEIVCRRASGDRPGVRPEADKRKSGPALRAPSRPGLVPGGAEREQTRERTPPTSGWPSGPARRRARRRSRLARRPLPGAATGPPDGAARAAHSSGSDHAERPPSDASLGAPGSVMKRRFRKRASGSGRPRTRVMAHTDGARKSNRRSLATPSSRLWCYTTRVIVAKPAYADPERGAPSSCAGPYAERQGLRPVVVQTASERRRDRTAGRSTTVLPQGFPQSLGMAASQSVFLLSGPLCYTIRQTPSFLDGRGRAFAREV